MFQRTPSQPYHSSPYHIRSFSSQAFESPSNLPQTNRRAHPPPRLVTSQPCPRRRLTPTRRGDDAERVGRHRPRCARRPPTSALGRAVPLHTHQYVPASALPTTHRTPLTPTHSRSPLSTLFIHLRTHTHHPRPPSRMISWPAPSACWRALPGRFVVVAQTRGPRSHCATCRRHGAREAAALTGAIVLPSALNMRTNSGSTPFIWRPNFVSPPPVCRSALLSNVRCRDLCHPISAHASCEKAHFRSVLEMIPTRVVLHAPSVFP